MDEKNEDSIGYEFKGKFMISSVGLLFLACVIIILFHVYYRWFRRRHLLLYHRSADSTAMTGSQGLEFSAVNSLPTFIYQSKNHEPPPECAVCLSEFEHNETGRILPECNHWFHIECIDMWLHSHCDCPICRARVKAADPVEEEIITVSISAPGSDSPSDETDTGCSSSSSPDVSTISMGRDPTKNEKDPDPVTNIGPDIESGSNLPYDSVQVQVQVQVRALKSFS